MKPMKVVISTYHAGKLLNKRSFSVDDDDVILEIAEDFEHYLFDDWDELQENEDE